MELFSPKTEEKILDFWKREQIFEKSLRNRAENKKFIFYEGPPSANGRPGLHHLLARAYKDLICRYKTMAGFYVGRKAGWDTHGLPVELQVEKELGLKNKKEIEKYGIAEFNRKAQEVVWKYKEEWDILTERMGFWLDLKNPYITYEPRYIESLWRIIALVWNKKLLYQDFKVVPYCARCGTALSSHEVAQGYEKVLENSVYIKFKLKPKQKIGVEFITGNNTYIISWTTTPWTLPGNTALAVGKKIEYEILELKSGENFIFAKTLKDSINIEEEKIKSSFITGKALIGLEYESLFSIPQLQSKTSYKIYSADFVNTEEGTGVVHIAPMYGIDDFNLGTAVGLPKVHTVDLNGKFIRGINKKLAGLYVKSSKTEEIILNYLRDNSNLLKIKKYEHEYPFCWRCQSPLLYYAKLSWFIGMEKLKKKLLENNKKINWVPANVKDGRFGGWLKEVKDWAFSRERYWGTPLPVWQCSKCQNKQVIGSLEELDKFSPKKLNKYIFLRHGEAENNRLNISSCWPEKKKYPLTIEGAEEIEKLIPAFKKKKIDLIFSSDLLRTKETAEIMAGALGIKVVYDKRLREHDFGIYNGVENDKIIKFFRNKKDTYVISPNKGENMSDVKKRMMDFLKFLDTEYEGKNILIISHNNPIISIISAYRGYKNEETFGLEEVMKFEKKTGSVFEMAGHNWPYDEEGGLNLHRPHIDDISLKCAQCSGAMKRVQDVVDVWFDSGAMPFAQNKKPEYPADFISEAVDQTRGWFYTLHAVGALMGRGPAFKNVICLGHILDEKGEKMSKSKNNIVAPMEIIDKYGIDALRWYFFTINPPGEPKRFIIRDVEERLKRFILTLSNVLVFYKTYGTKIMTKKPDFGSDSGRSRTSDSLLDKWILSRLNQTIKIVRTNLDKYEVVQAARPIDNFIDDLSRWWLRRSRKRFSDNDNASAVLRTALEALSKLIAPFTPFLAEHIWQGLGNKNSVHLADYPKPQLKLIVPKLEEQMNFAKEMAAKGLALRAEAEIKVRQPLAMLEIKNQKSNIKIDKELLGLIKDEVNVKEIIFGDKFELDTKITAELKEEGLIRELARTIQEMRRDGGLVPADFVKIYLKLDDELKSAVSHSQKSLRALTGAKTIEFASAAKDGLLADKHFKIDNKDIWVGIIKL